jgi:hypothetical protein
LPSVVFRFQRSKKSYKPLKFRVLRCERAPQAFAKAGKDPVLATLVRKVHIILNKKRAIKLGRVSVLAIAARPSDAELFKNSLKRWFESASAINSYVILIFPTRNSAREAAASRPHLAVPVEVIHGAAEVALAVTVPKHFQTLRLELTAELKHAVVARVVIQDFAGKHYSVRIDHVSAQSETECSTYIALVRTAPAAGPDARP